MTTHTVTLNLPESLYQRLSRRSRRSQRSLEDELLAILTAKVPDSESAGSIPLAHDEVINFLGRGPTAEEIAEFRLSPAAQARAQALLRKSKEGTLSSDEEAELELYIDLEDFMALVKIRALEQLQSRS